MLWGRDTAKAWKGETDNNSDLLESLNENPFAKVKTGPLIFQFQ